MTPELGHFALILALMIAGIQFILPLIGAQMNNYSLMLLARSTAFSQCLMLVTAFVILTYSFINNDFSVVYVASNSNTALPLPYRIAAVWGAHEGSLLLWSMVLGFWMVAVALYSKGLPDVFVARVLAVMGAVNLGFIAFMLFTSNPFLRHFPVPTEGRDLNPLLQDPGLVFHPPMLYMGYVGFSVAFSFAIAALIGGRLDAAWARWSRPWTVIAWIFLSIGITLGSWWAYYELGWGGWWFWDPVENASFMPWLVGTALIHSLAVTEKRDAFKGWTVLLAICAFSLSLLGTFLVRSGVLTSVHAFATDPTRGVFILVLLTITIGSSLFLYALRAPKIQDIGRFAINSREGFLLANNILLVVAAASVLIGTLYPLVVEAIKQGKISVGPPYFNAVFIPFMMVLAVVLGLGQSARWKHQDIKQLLKQMLPCLIGSLLMALLIVILSGYPVTSQAFVGVLLAFWIVISSGLSLADRIRHRPSLISKLNVLSKSFIGMTIAHIGFAVTIIGVTMTSLYSIERDVRMDVGQTYELSGYRFELTQLNLRQGPNYRAMEAEVKIYQDNHLEADLWPQKRIYRVQTMPMTEAGIDAGFFRDIYVALGEQLSEQSWSLRLQIKPYVRWIWSGGILMALGGIFAVSDRRYRIVNRSMTTTVANASSQWVSQS